MILLKENVEHYKMFKKVNGMYWDVEVEGPIGKNGLQKYKYINPAKLHFIFVELEFSDMRM